MPSPKVLIVAYAFPPHSVVGAQRPLRMVKYLPRMSDWQPIVLSVKREFPRTDPSLLAEIPDGVPVYRAPSWEPLHWLERSARRPGAGATAGHAPQAPGLAAAAPPQPRRSPAAIATAPLRGAKRLLTDLCSTPDPQLGWVPAAVASGLRIARRHRPDVILVTVPPWSALAIGHHLSALTGIPWIADYRDPWTDIHHGDLPAWRLRGERRLERALLGNASAVLSSSARFTELMRAKFPDRPRTIFAPLFNGFDEAKFADPPPPRHELFTITHLGSLYNLYKPEPMLHGLRHWLAQDPARRQRVRLRFIGQIDGATRALLERLDMLALTEELGFLPHAAAIAECRRSHVLLLAMGITPRTPSGWMPSKLYEYLACRTPILANTVRGEAAEAIVRAAAGEVVHGDDPGEMAAALDALHRRSITAAPVEPGAWPPAIARFTQAEIIPALAEILERVRRRRSP